MLAGTRRLAAATAGALTLALAPGLASCGGSAVRAAGPAWQRVWTGTFAGPAGTGVAAQQWQYDTGHGIFGNHEIETSTRSVRNVHVDGHGTLSITALGHGGSWTSGRIQTRRRFAVPAGGELRVSAAIRQPGPAAGLGYWPAFWLLGPGSWPQHGEIDILEDVNALSRHSGTLHCGNLSQRNPDGTFGPCHEPAGTGTSLLPCAGCQQRFHSYSVIIDRRRPGSGSIRWYLDRRQFFTVRERQVGRAAWAAATSGGYVILLDVAMGGDYPNYACGCRTPTAQTTSGGTMSVRDLTVDVRG